LFVRYEIAHAYGAEVLQDASHYARARCLRGDVQVRRTDVVVVVVIVVVVVVVVVVVIVVVVE